MRIGLLETGAPPQSIGDRFGDYPSMFRRLLGETTYDWSTYAVADGTSPPSVEACDAYIVTGSSAGVYDPLPSIADLQDFLISAKGRAPLVGVCFGHQIMAQAFGGQVIKSPKGWGVGLHTYEVQAPQAWMDGGGSLAAAASHQDQVVVAPPGATVVAGSTFTPFGMLAYDDQPAISIQLHPEFEPAYAQALIEARRGARYTDAQADAAIGTYAAPDDRQRIGGWIRTFLERSSKR